MDPTPGDEVVLISGMRLLSARGEVLLEINRMPVNSVAGFRRAIGASASGGVLAVYLYDPELEQRAIKIVHTEPH